MAAEHQSGEAGGNRSVTIASTTADGRSNSALDTANTSGSAGIPRLEDYNVVWDSPSADARGSMPLGNGDLSLNAWIEADGGLVFYIGKTDATNARHGFERRTRDGFAKRHPGKRSRDVTTYPLPKDRNRRFGVAE